MWSFSIHNMEHLLRISNMEKSCSSELNSFAEVYKTETTTSEIFGQPVFMGSSVKSWLGVKSKFNVP